jgi:hypothetical protein
LVEPQRFILNAQVPSSLIEGMDVMGILENDFQHVYPEHWAGASVFLPCPPAGTIRQPSTSYLFQRLF